MSQAGGSPGAGKHVPVAALTVDPVPNSQSEGSHPRVCELLVQEDALYVSGRVEENELELLIDTGCSLSLISKDIFEKIPEERRLELVENEVRMTTAGGSLLLDYGKIHFLVQVWVKVFEHPFIVAELTNEGILGVYGGSLFLPGTRSVW